ncbi:MAG: 7-cyano-7-deazaguanine synthase [Candidatus Omnitrophica bacterium]|nr:7-cyano-7-deazaguanine synthase [Candidatus Omnitrophota bacterium]MDD5236519.1 7-cyano-7-deazaguanine synthase [Candidatus Omnitrophota bacterium]MDD5610245.1 7-cyano-7-deazaguanine synthase [Candidatus Omnitrophota bacterium]
MKAIALLSGGLDSTLAAKLIKDQGIDVVALHFTSPFCLCDKRSPKNIRSHSGCRNEALEAAKVLGLEFKTLAKGQEILEIIKKPKHGFGSNMNPCIDCRILMFKKAKEFMQECGASFIFTGEVLGQRPMSQKKNTMDLIDKEAGLEGEVLRPLSAKILPETQAEKNGWVDREKLLDFSGRTRRPQMDLAENYNIKDYPCASGGCLLTEPEFAKRLKDLLKHAELTLNEVELLKTGRHFRISEYAKLVVGRDERENERLSSLKAKEDYLLMPKELKGPASLLRGKVEEKDLSLSAEITAHYCDRNGQALVKIAYSSESSNGEKESAPIAVEKLESFRI